MSAWDDAGELAALRECVGGILVRHSRSGLGIGALTSATALIDTGLELASVDLLEALVEIESVLHVRLTDEDLTLDSLSSFGVFLEHVCKRLSAQPSGAPSGPGSTPG